MLQPGFELDFLAVGDGESSGDAIALRHIEIVNGEMRQFVAVIDGGTKDSGEQLVRHINQYYGTNRVDIVISTHPDRDHSSGLSVVLERMDVGQLLMHLPWNYAGDVKDFFANPRLTLVGLETSMEKSLRHAKELEEIAVSKNIPIVEPFTGMGIEGFLTVLGPSREYYQDLLPHFRGTPEPKKEMPLLQKIMKGAEDTVATVFETLDIETLDDSSDHCSAENRSSAIILFNFNGKKVLLTGDADIDALTAAANFADRVGVALDDLHIFQVPHHGSKHNVGPTILNRIRAEKSQISASKEGGSRHPAKKVVNALIRRNSQVFVTQGQCIVHHSLLTGREGWGPVQHLPFYDQVDV